MAGSPTVADLMATGLDERNARVIVRGDELAKELIEANPTMDPITAHIVGGDMAMGEYRGGLVEAGNDPLDHVWLIGSYARLDWAIKYCPHDWVIDNLADLWRGSDPDDSRPEYLLLWREAAAKAPLGYVHDDERHGANPLPKRKRLTIYRGQMHDGDPGLSWSLDYQTADKFARGAGVRRPMAGSVFRARVARRKVLAYLTERGEAEVIVSPFDVEEGEEVARYELRPKAAKSDRRTG